MAVSATRLAELRAEFEKVKLKIDDIDRKYSLDYVEPQLNMPESLNLPPLSYEPKTEEQLTALAEEQTLASHLSALARLQSANAADMLRIDRQLSDSDEKTRIKIADLLKKLNDEIEDVQRRITNAGMLFSTVAERIKFKLRRQYEQDVNECNTQADNTRQSLETERTALNDKYNQSVLSLEQQRQARINGLITELTEKERDELEKVQKYNAVLSEKETKYQMSRAKALEAARQAEYDRAYKAKKLYQQMGAAGYEESVLWEKYNVFVAHFANFTKREEALILIQGDNYVQLHLKQYYSTLVEWVNRNVPA